MNPTDAVTVLQIALVFVGALAVILWMLPSPCSCEKCAFHVNEKRMERARQAEAQHDIQHKGFGYRDGDPDIRDCRDSACSRNRNGVE